MLVRGGAVGIARSVGKSGLTVRRCTTLNHSAGGPFVTYVKAFPANAHDGHTLDAVIPDIERQTGGTIRRLVDGEEGQRIPEQPRRRTKGLQNGRWPPPLPYSADPCCKGGRCTARSGGHPYHPARQHRTMAGDGWVGTRRSIANQLVIGGRFPVIWRFNSAARSCGCADGRGRISVSLFSSVLIKGCRYGLTAVAC
jgi:hypothetical protein